MLGAPWPPRRPAGALLLRAGRIARGARADLRARRHGARRCCSPPSSPPAIPLRLLVPDAWDDLAAGMAEGIASMPAISVPYRGVDEWVRIAIVLGGVALTGRRRAARLLAGRAPPRTPGPASRSPPRSILGALYAVPVIQRSPDQPFLGGAVFCVLLGPFLWARAPARRPGRRRRGALRRRGTGVGLIARAAPRRAPTRGSTTSRSPPDLAARATTARFDWNHSYGAAELAARRARGPAHPRARRPRTGRRRPSTSSTAALASRDPHRPPAVPTTEFTPRAAATGSQTIRVVVNRGLRSREFVAAGYDAADPRADGPARRSRTRAGQLVQTVRGPLRPRQLRYRARVYVPRPTERELRAAGDRLPAVRPATTSRRTSGGVRGEPVDPGTGAPAIGAPLRAKSSRSAWRAEPDRCRLRQRLRESPTATAVLDTSALAPRVATSPSACAAASTRRTTTCGRARPRAATTPPTPSRPPRSRASRSTTFLFDDRTRLLPAVLGRDGAAAAHGRRARARGLGLQPGPARPRARRVRRARPRRALVGRGLLPALSAGSRFDPTPAIAPARSQTGDDGSAGRRRRAGRAPACRPTARATRPATRRGTGVRRRGRRLAARRAHGGRARRPARRGGSSCSCAAGACRAARRRRSWPSCSARCTAAAAPRRRP